jgi:hypothetical protein
MFEVKHLRPATCGLALTIALSTLGCRQDINGAPGGEPGAKASAATEVGGGVTSDSPGGGNITPSEGKAGGVR